MNIEEGVSLAPFTTFHIGGPARMFAEARSEEDIRTAQEIARAHNLPLLPLGGGSNLLVPDEGVNAFVLKLAMSDIALTEVGDATHLVAGAGARWDDVVDAAVSEGLWGIENLAGIPGTVGGAIVQNIGAYGAVVADTVLSVTVYDTDRKVIVTFLRADCAFEYRTSIFKRESPRFIILGATFALGRTAQPALAYRDLAERFAEEMPPDLARIRDVVRAIRAQKFPDLAAYGTAGSFFLNPVLPEDEANAVAARFPGMPLFPMPEGGMKVPVAWLLDYRHGVLDIRDARQGGAFVWPAQPLVIAAERGASASDVDALAEEIARRTRDATGITLEREVRLFGTSYIENIS